jgi:hypothetical protein
MSATEPKALLYKPAGKDSNNQRSGGPWGSKCTFAAAMPTSLRAMVTDLWNCSKHNGERKGLLYRASEASRLPPTSYRRLIRIQMVDFPFFFLQKHSVLHSELAMDLVLLHG